MVARSTNMRTKRNFIDFSGFHDLARCMHTGQNGIIRGGMNETKKGKNNDSVFDVVRTRGAVGLADVQAHLLEILADDIHNRRALADSDGNDAFPAASCDWYDRFPSDIQWRVGSGADAGDMVAGDNRLYGCPCHLQRTAALCDVGEGT